MKVGILQEAFVFGDVDGNYRRAEEAIAESARAGADTVLLPEMWTTYFSKENMAQTADVDAARTTEFLSRLAKKYGVNVVGGSISEQCDGVFYNSSLVFNRDGEQAAYYRKAHLYQVAREHTYFTPGDEIATFELDGAKCGVAICHDISFPEWIRLYALAGVEVMFLPTGWPEAGIENWLHLSRARAIENQMFIVCANSCGVGSFKFGGNSIVVDPNGATRLLLGEEPERRIVEIDAGDVDSARQRFNLLEERRPEYYGS